MAEPWVGEVHRLLGSRAACTMVNSVSGFRMVQCRAVWVMEWVLGRDLPLVREVSPALSLTSIGAFYHFLAIF